MSNGKERAAKNAGIVEKTIEEFNKKVEGKNVTVGDLVRLFELQKEIGGNEPREIKITWVESGETESTTET